MKHVLRLMLGVVVWMAWSAAGSTNTTVVVFPLRTWAAGGLNRGLVLTPVYSPLTDGSNVFWGQPLKFQPTNGVVSARLVPNDYDVSLEGVSGMWRISVPATNRVMWATECTTNVTSYSYGATHQTEWPWAAITNAPAVVTNGSGPSFGTTHVGQLGVAGGSYGGAYVVIDENGEASGRAEDTVWALGITGMSYFMRGIVVGADPGPPNTNVFIIDGDGVASGNGRGLTNVPAFTTTGRSVYATNANSGAVIDSKLPYQLFVTNASMTVSGFSGLTNGRQHVLSMTVSNSSASGITWNGPPTAFYIGAASSAALSIPAGKEGVVSFWVWPSVRTNVCNAVQQ